MRCHNGPYFSSFGFHNIGSGVNPESGSRDFGRLFGLKSARVDEFNCIGRYSDLDADACRELIYATEGHADDGAFKVPGLRDVALTAPYFHDGRFETLKESLEFYRSPPDQLVSGNELLPLDLSDDELQDIAAFLGSLTGEDRRATRQASK
jgi:cytochrome c peroxidase